MIPFIIIVVILIAIITVLLTIFTFKNQKKRPVDYKALFVMGIIFMGAGIAIGNYGISAMGLIFFLIGALNKDKWNNARKWEKLGKKDKRTLMIALIAGILVFVVGVLFYLLQIGYV
ncbi:MAG: hypothetical protein ABH828_06475 [archaeon]